MKSYRKAFIAALAVNVLLVAGLVLLGRRGPSAPQANGGMASEQDEAGPPAGGESGSAEKPPAETPLVPVQLTPQRLQSIGVKTGVVEMKSVHDEIRTMGSVEPDETRLAYVQVRFPGWIQKVFADSTYQYVRKEIGRASCRERV